MTVTVLLFASLKDAAGSNSIQVNLAAPGDKYTVADLLQACTEQFPRLAAWLPHVRVALNQEYVKSDAPISQADEIAFLPPVSGG